jgi:hypothetical protein
MHDMVPIVETMSYYLNVKNSWAVRLVKSLSQRVDTNEFE